LDIKNIAIIAHVDHGKTTLIDGLFKEAGTFKTHKLIEERIMDSGDIEKERGITITAKNASFVWKNVNINIVDTPGHSDFGGEVERALYMVDGALLLVDASEGPLPQTRFVLRKAFEKNLKILVIINKIDRPDSRIKEVEEKIFDLFCDNAYSENQLEYKTFYASSKNGYASSDINIKKDNLLELLDAIIDYFPSPKINFKKPFSMLITNRIYNSFMGLAAIGRIESGTINVNQKLVIIDEKEHQKEFTVTALEKYSGLKTIRVDSLQAGEIAIIFGIQNPEIGDTICDKEHVTILPRIKVDPPTVSVKISVNTSPFAGQDGTYLTTRRLEELLKKACLANVSIKVENTINPEVFILKARGELQIVILVEELRRQGFEFMVGAPNIIPFKIDGKLYEAQEVFVIDVPSDKVGVVTELLGARGGKMDLMDNLSNSSRVRLEFTIPARGLFGIRSKLLTETKGEAVFSSSFKDYIPYKGSKLNRKNGALISDRTGTSVQYALFHLQARGRLFIKQGVKVYEGMIFGENNRDNDLTADPTKIKKLTNMRASGSDDSTKLNTVNKLELDEAITWIDEDEWVEITPKNIRLRKHELKTNLRSVIRNK